MVLPSGFIAFGSRLTDADERNATKVISSFSPSISTIVFGDLG
jgi:hypothetical protein